MKYDILKLIKFDHPQFQLLNEPHVFPSKKKKQRFELIPPLFLNGKVLK